MASPVSGTSSGSTSLLQNSGSEEDLQQLMDQRKRKRMISNRESARRSRMRKQKHLDDLTALVSQLREENGRIVAGISAATQQYLKVEAENQILRAQVAELSSRLQSINDIIVCLSAPVGGGVAAEEPFSVAGEFAADHSWDYLYLHQPIMASADALQY